MRCGAVDEESGKQCRRLEGHAGPHRHRLNGMTITWPDAPGTSSEAEVVPRQRDEARHAAHSLHVATGCEAMHTLLTAEAACARERIVAQMSRVAELESEVSALSSACSTLSSERDERVAALVLAVTDYLDDPDGGDEVLLRSKIEDVPETVRALVERTHEMERRMAALEDEPSALLDLLTPAATAALDAMEDPDTAWTVAGAEVRQALRRALGRDVRAECGGCGVDLPAPQHSPGCKWGGAQ